MPLEFSVAAFRFGHSMVRAAYDHNENFGRQPTAPTRPAGPRTFEQLFQFTGSGVIKGAAADPASSSSPHLPDNWPIRWTRFTDGDQPDRFARKIDTHLAPPLKDLSNEGNGRRRRPVAVPVTDPQAARRAQPAARLPAGHPDRQAVAGALGVTPLTDAQLLKRRPAASPTR